MDRLRPRCDVAIIVPVRNECAELDRLLDDIESMSMAPQEIIVVAGDRNETLQQLSAARKFRLIEMQPNRGAQLDCGARAAAAKIVWFVHANARFGPNALAALVDACAHGAESGCFRFSFQGPGSWIKAIVSGLVAMRIRCGGIPYGDQALFAVREVYTAAGGFAAQPLFDEVRLVRRLRRRGTFKVLPEAVYVSPRRWEADGWIRRSLGNRWLAICHALGVPAAALNSVYRRATKANGETGS